MSRVPVTMTRRCEQCHLPTSGFLRMTQRLDGVLVRACEDCALDLEREKEQAAHAAQKGTAA